MIIHILDAICVKGPRLRRLPNPAKNSEWLSIGRGRQMMQAFSLAKTLLGAAKAKITSYRRTAKRPT
jgi:hypothetical protein